MCLRLLSAAVAFGVFAVVVPAGGSGPVDLNNGGDLHEGIGQGDTKQLSPGVTYTASSFPLVLHVRAPDGFWGGVQFHSGRYAFVQLSHLRPTGTPVLHGVGYITIEATSGSTPTAAGTLKNLLATPHMKAGPVKAVTVAGFHGKSFDATITAIDKPGAGGVSIVPFTTNRHCGFCEKTLHHETQDVKVGEPGQRFRISVITVRGKTVVIYLESIYGQPKYPPAKLFPTFTPYANRLLAALTFPG